MSKCSPKQLKFEPKDPSLPNLVPGFGISKSLNIDLNPDLDLDGYAPPDLDYLTKLVDLIMPGGSLKQPYNIKVDESVFDAIVKYMDKAYPFLMYYKLLLPILELILCIIEVLCALPNPFKTVRAVRRLFRNCIPNFLSIFPIFALPLFLISLLLLLIALIEYILQQLAKIIELITKNIRILRNAYERKDAISYKAVLQKIAWSLCVFEGLFVVFSIFKAIFDVIKEILNRSFSLPPCDDGVNSDDSCCSTDVCPAFFKNKEIESRSGTLQYLHEIRQASTFASGLIGTSSNIVYSTVRNQSIQFFDAIPEKNKQFINISRPYDLSYEKVFFPKDVSYNKDTPPQQAPYTVDMRIFYVPQQYGRYDAAGSRFVKIKDCIVVKEPVSYIDTYENQTSNFSEGVLRLAGGKVFEDDGVTPVNLNGSQATIDSLINKPAEEHSYYYLPDANDAITYTSVSYTLKINHDLLSMKHGLITIGCLPEASEDKASLSAAVGSAAAKQGAVKGILADNFPDPSATIDEVNTALSGFRANVSVEGANLLRDTVTVSLNKLKQDALRAVEKMILISYDQYKSNVYLDTDMQFTTLPIKVKAEILDANGQSVTSNLPASVASNVAKKISAQATFGNVGDFEYDGSRYFYANISSEEAGQGSITLIMDQNVISKLDIPSDLTKPISISAKSLDYKFVFASPMDSSSAVSADNRRSSSDVASNVAVGSDVAINSEGV